MTKIKVWLMRFLHIPFEYVTTYKNENGDKVLTLVVVDEKRIFATNFIVDRVVDAGYKQATNTREIEEIFFNK